MSPEEDELLQSTWEVEMGKRMVFLAGLLALMVAVGWVMTSPAWAQPDADFVDDDVADGDFDQRVIPEPATMALTGLGLGALGIGYRFRKRKRS